MKELYKFSPFTIYFNVGDTVNKPYFKKWWSVPLTLASHWYIGMSLFKWCCCSNIGHFISPQKTATGPAVIRGYSICYPDCHHSHSALQPISRDVELQPPDIGPSGERRGGTSIPGSPETCESQGSSCATAASKWDIFLQQQICPN